MGADEAMRAARSLNAGTWRLAGIVPFIAFASGLAILVVQGWDGAAPSVIGLWAAGLALLLFGLLMPRLDRRDHGRAWQGAATRTCSQARPS